MWYTYYIISGLLFLVIDSIYLISISKYTKNIVTNIQNNLFEINILYVILCYILLISGTNYFIIQNNNLSLKEKYINSFILGVFVYGVYEFTNGAIFKKWPLKLIIIDTLWGGVLFFIVTYFTLLIHKIYIK